jgi:hypothetical protein
MPFDSNTYKKSILSKMNTIFTESIAPVEKIDETQDSINVGGLSALLNPQTVGAAIQKMTPEQLAAFGLTKNQINIITASGNAVTPGAQASTQPQADPTQAAQGQSELSDLTQPEHPAVNQEQPVEQPAEEPQAPLA